MTTTAPIRVVLIGGGYATLHAYRSLARRVRGGERNAEISMTVISADDHHNFHGFTGEVVAGLLPLAVTRTPLAAVLPQARFVHGRVLRVDLTHRMVVVETEKDGTERHFPYDQLVVGAGGREPVDRVPGMAEHGFTLRAPGEFPRFLHRLSAVLGAEADHRPGTGAGAADRDDAVVIVGGGMAGVELAAAVADRLRASGAGRRVVLVHSGAAVLPGVRDELPAVAVRVDRELARLGVEVRAGSAVTAVGPAHVELSDGTHLAATVVLGTIGQRPVALPGLESLPHDGAGRLLTGPTLEVAQGVWAAGDTARVAHPRTGKPVAANALWAIKAGGHLGRNISRVADGRQPRPFRYRGLGMAMAFGLGRSATELYGIPIPGLAGWLLRLGFFLRFMPQRGRAVSVVTGLAALPWRGRVLPSAPSDRGPERVSAS